MNHSMYVYRKKNWNMLEGGGGLKLIEISHKGEADTFSGSPPPPYFLMG